MSQELNTTTRIERVLAYSALTIIAVAVLSFFATLIAGLVGVSREALAVGFWPFVTWVAYVGLPIGFVLIVTLLIITRRRRVRDYDGETSRRR